MSTANVHAFIAQLKETSFRAQLAPSLSTIKEGDWEAVSQLASQHGFPFNAAELQAEMKHYPGFFKGAGGVPQAGWDRSTLA